MNLLIDMGNTRLKWACEDAGRLSTGGVFVVHSDTLEQDLGAIWQGLDKPAKVGISSDVDENLLEKLKGWISAQWGTGITVLKPVANAYGVNNAYDDPIKLGSDRWAALIAARNVLAKASIIVDCGTAITIDAITADGQHLGGVIVPGVTKMHEALQQAAYKIEQDDRGIQGNVARLANNTQDAINNGIYTTVVSLINDMVNSILQFSDMSGVETALVITGGNAQIIQPLLQHDFQHRPQLVLEGLAVVLEGDI